MWYLGIVKLMCSIQRDIWQQQTSELAFFSLKKNTRYAEIVCCKVTEQPQFSIQHFAYINHNTRITQMQFFLILSP